MIYFLSMWNGDAKKVVIFMEQKTWSNMQNVAVLLLVKRRGRNYKLQSSLLSDLEMRAWKKAWKKVKRKERNPMTKCEYGKVIGFLFLWFTKKKKKKRRTYNWTSSARKGANFLLGVTEEEPDCKHCTRWIDRRKENRYGFRQHNTYGEKLSTDRK